MTNQFEHDLFSEVLEEDGISSSGYKNKFRNQRYPAIVIDVENSEIIEIKDNILSVNNNKFLLENKTISQLLTEINNSGTVLSIKLMSQSIAMLPATLLEDFSSRETVICDIIKSPFKLTSVFSNIIENIPSSKVSTAYNVELISIFDKSNNEITPSSIEQNNVFLSRIDTNLKAIVDTYLSSMVIFVTKEKVSSSYNVINNMDDNYIKNQLLTSITSHNTSRI